MNVEEYVLEDGTSPFKKWFDSLDAVAAAKVTAAQLRMEQGILSAIKWFEGIGEYRIDWGPGIRIYLAKDGDQLIILFGGGTKQRQNADIKEATRLHAEYKARKAKLKAEEAKRKSEQERINTKSTKKGKRK